jgi:Mitochondrial K+-H+ exchange-related
MGTIYSIPNIPFFYLVYRAWSHWRALSGSKHIQFLLEHDLVNAKPSPMLDVLYSAGIMRAKRDNTLTSVPIESDKGESKPRETMVLHRWNSKVIAQALEVPELEVELDRAIWQVEGSLREREESNEENKKET